MKYLSVIGLSVSSLMFSFCGIGNCYHPNAIRDYLSNAKSAPKSDSNYQKRNYANSKSEFHKKGGGGEDRTYTCIFGSRDQGDVLDFLMRKPEKEKDDDFCDWLFGNSWPHSFWCANELMKHQTSSDLQDLDLIIQDYDTIKDLVLQDSYVTWTNFRDKIKKDVNLKRRSALIFKVVYFFALPNCYGLVAF